VRAERFETFFGWSDYLVHLVGLVCLVYLVCLVCLVCLVYLVAVSWLTVGGQVSTFDISLSFIFFILSFQWLQ